MFDLSFFRGRQVLTLEMLTPVQKIRSHTPRSKFRTVAGGTSIAIALAVVVVLGWLVVPWAPSKSQAVDFLGYIELPGSRGLNVLDYLSIQDHHLFITAESTGSVYRVDLVAGKPLEGATVHVMAGAPATHGVALLPAGKIGFVSRSEADTVDAIDTESLAVVKSIPVAEDADAILYDPDSQLVYVAHGDPKLATLIDPKLMQPVGTIPLGGKPEFQQLDPVTHLLLQNIEDLDQVVAVNLKQRTLSARWKLPGCGRPTGMAIDASNRRLFILCAANARLAVFNLETHQVVATVPIGSGPDAIAFDVDLHRLYVAGKGGFLTVISQNTPDDYAVMDNVRTHYGAHTLVLDPLSHAVYVGYASLFASPRLAVFVPKQ